MDQLDKKGQAAIYLIMVALVIIILALAFAPVVRDFTESARNSTSGDTLGMDCSNSSISNFDKAACYATDLNLFYFIGGLIFVGAALIGAKLIFGGS